MAKHTAIRLKNQELRHAMPPSRVQMPPVRQLLPDPSQQEYFARPRRSPMMKRFLKFLIIVVALLLIYYLLFKDNSSTNGRSCTYRPSSGKMTTYYF